MSYIFIPYIRAQRINAMATPWLASPLPLFASTMLAHAICDDLGLVDQGVAYFHHSAQLLAERNLPQTGGQVFPHQYRGASFINKYDYSSKNKHALSLQPTCSAHVVCSILIKADGPAPSVEDVKAVLLGRSLAGGRIVSHGKIMVFDDWHDIPPNLLSGFVAMDMTHLLEGAENPLEALLRSVHSIPISEESKKEPGRWRTATVLGYCAITDFEEKSLSRDGCRHAFGEAMVGLVDLVSFRQIPEKDREQIFWSHGWPNENVFLITNGGLK